MEDVLGEPPVTHSREHEQPRAAEDEGHAKCGGDAARYLRRADPASLRSSRPKRATTKPSPMMAMAVRAHASSICSLASRSRAAFCEGEGEAVHRLA